MKVLIHAASLVLLCRAAAQELYTATRQAEQLVQAQPTAVNWQKLGLTHYLRNQYEPAVKAFEQAVQLDAKLWPSYLFLGISRYRLNQFAAALTSLQEADRLAPAITPGRDDLDYWLGATHIALRSPLVGLAAIERLLARNASHVAALQLATEVYAESASFLWNGIAEQAFSSSPGQEVHGHALESEGNTAGALQAFQEAVRLAPQRPGPGAAIARLSLHSGARDQAAAAVARELSLDPASPETNLYAGLLAIGRNRFEEATGPLIRAAQWMPANEEPLLALGQVYLALQQLDKALAAAREAVTLEERSAAAHELLLAVLAALKDEAGVAAEHLRWQSVR